MLTSLGKTWLYAGINNTSSKVSPSPKNLELADLALGELEIVAMCKNNKLQVTVAGCRLLAQLFWTLPVFYHSLNESIQLIAS